MTKTDVQNDFGSTAGAGSLPAAPAAAVLQLPWAVGDGRSATISILARDGTSHSNYVAMVNYRGNSLQERVEQEAIAAFIVRACNAHNELVAALKVGLALINDEYSDPRTFALEGHPISRVARDAWDKGCAALALAEPSST